jgi:hypothetical protein
MISNGGDAMARTVANIYEGTRELLNKVKEDYDFKSDDQAIKLLCQLFLEDDRNSLLRKYIEVKSKIKDV